MDLVLGMLFQSEASRVEAPATEKSTGKVLGMSTRVHMWAIEI